MRIYLRVYFNFSLKQLFNYALLKTPPALSRLAYDKNNNFISILNITTSMLEHDKHKLFVFDKIVGKYIT